MPRAAAAIGIAMVESSEIDAGRAHASLLRPRPYEPVDPGPAPTRSHYPAPERNARADAHAATEAAIAAARVDPASARSLYNFLQAGCRIAKELDETAQLFADHGIPLTTAEIELPLYGRSRGRPHLIRP